MVTPSTTRDGEPLGTLIDYGDMQQSVVGAKILVVEDEHLVALDIQSRLVRMGHMVVVAYSGEAAVREASEAEFDLILMDIKLSGAIDGIEAARQIHEHSDVPIVYLTAYADSTTLERARPTEPYGYVVKPFQERELRATIDMALQRHESDRRRWEQSEIQRFLSEASAHLTATLDYRAVARGAADLLVPRFADWCEIRLLEVDDSVPAYSYSRPNGETLGAAPEHGARLIEEVQRTGRAEIITQITDPASLRDALGSRHLGVLGALGPRSLICVPLRAREHVLGVLAMVTGRGRTRYDTSDLALAEDFCHRLGLALDNALLYRRAERAVRMRDEVLAIVSHDLRTPLSKVLLQAEEVAEQPGLRETGESIVRSIDRMNRLIGDLLDASSINAGQLALDLAPHGISRIARDAAELFRAAAKAKSITLVEKLPDEAVRVRCDRDRLVQVLANLIGNALKFTPAGGTITLAVDVAGSRVRVNVIDTGAGIPPDQIPHLFDRFWRGHAGGKGSGLGLFIARGIVAAHGSTLDVETAVGSGSRFSFALPIAP